LASSSLLIENAKAGHAVRSAISTSSSTLEIRTPIE